MRSVSSLVLIARPCRQVGALLRDLRRWPRLAPAFSGLEILLEAPRAALSLQPSRSPLGLGPGRLTLRRFHPGRIEFRHFGQFLLQDHAGEWSFRPAGPRRTRLRLTHRFRVPGGPLGRLAEAALARFYFARHLPRLLQALRRSLEAAPACPPAS